MRENRQATERYLYTARPQQISTRFLYSRSAYFAVALVCTLLSIVTSVLVGALCTRADTQPLLTVCLAGSGIFLNRAAPVLSMAVALDPASVSAAQLRSVLTEALHGKDLGLISLSEIRKQVSQKLGFQLDALDSRRKEFKKIARDVVEALQGQQITDTAILQELLGEAENAEARQQVYLITLARVLDAMLPDGRAYADLNALDRKAIAAAVLDAFDNPVPLVAHAAGRPRAPRGDDQPSSIVTFLAVFRELHADGDVHFHVVVKLVGAYRYKRAKQTLRDRHALPSHFSCSHTLLWSAVRYGYIETLKKPDVDDSPWVWTPTWSGFAKDTQTVDLFEMSQEPFRADSWRKRREDKDKEASKKGAKTKFEKLDLTSLMMSKHLWSKDSITAYAQDHGTVAMKRFVHNNQSKLGTLINDGKQWASARDNAAFEAIDDWSLVCQTAAKPCPHGQEM